ncbi:MAG: hypothetical protein S0880_13135 [Actinomycetota bacterium]|nr:hypothetical protein [Actinomycetota bacterium]
MAELDFAILADYARVAEGLGYLVAGGIDRIGVPDVPAGRNVGLLVRLSFVPGELGRPHRLEVIVSDDDGDRLLHVNAVLEPERPPGQRPGRPTQFIAALNFGLPIPKIGSYSIDLVLDDVGLKSIPVEVERIDHPMPPAIS